MLERLDEVEALGFRQYYFQFTLNDYVREGLEPNVPPVAERIDTFKRLVDRIGKERVIWRFDPLMLGCAADTAVGPPVCDAADTAVGPPVAAGTAPGPPVCGAAEQSVLYLHLCKYGGSYLRNSRISQIRSLQSCNRMTMFTDVVSGSKLFKMKTSA